VTRVNFFLSLEERKNFNEKRKKLRKKFREFKGVFNP